MTRQTAWVVLGLAALSSCACAEYRKQQLKKELTAEVQKVIAARALHTQEGRGKWGLTECNVFGSQVSGQAEVNQVTESPPTYDVVLPFWCDGKSLEGQPVKLKRKLEVTLSRPAEGAPWKVEKYRFLADEPLTTGSQFGSWFVALSAYWLLVMCICPTIPIAIFSGKPPEEVGVGVSLGSLGGLICAGYFAYNCFDSGWAVLLLVPLYFVLNLVFLGMWNGFAQGVATARRAA